MSGLKSGDIKLQVNEDNMLVVCGERQREEEKEGVKYVKLERRIDKFMRKFVLPENANLEKIKDVCQDGDMSSGFFGFVEGFLSESHGRSDQVFQNSSQAKEALCQGFRWVIATKDPWLSKKVDFKVEKHWSYEHRNETVSSLFYPGTKLWDSGKVYEMFTNDDAKAILETSVPQQSVEDRMVWSMSTDGIYNVWEDKLVPAVTAMELSFKYVDEWRKAKGKVTYATGDYSARVLLTRKWTPPPQGMLKVNVDASVYPQADSFSIGMVLRDHTGLFLEAKVLTLPCPNTVFEAECIGVGEALSWVIQRGEDNVILESDSLLTVNAVRKKEYLIEVGHRSLQEASELHTRF
ncbi:hypothetical protein AgCh_009436 [Apium graveolens]